MLAIGPLVTDVSSMAVVSPYFVPNDKLVDYFARMETRGPRVRILTNSLAANDAGLVHAGYMRYRKDLLRAGVDLYEFKPDPASLGSKRTWTGSLSSSLHAKFMGADAKLVNAWQRFATRFLSWVVPESML